VAARRARGDFLNDQSKCDKNHALPHMSNNPRSMSTNGISKTCGPASINMKKEVEKTQPRKKNVLGFATLFFVDSVRRIVS